MSSYAIRPSGSKNSASYAKFVFFVLIGNTRWQPQISTHLLTFSLLFGKILLCCPKIIPVRRDILMWISFRVWLHFNHTKRTSWVFICEQYKWYLFKYYVMLLIWSTVLSQVWKMFYLCYKTLELVLKLLHLELFPLRRSTKGSSFHWFICTRFGAVIIVDFT